MNPSASPRYRLRRLWRALRRPRGKAMNRRQRGAALLTVTIAIAVIGATTADFAYNAQVDMEAAANSRDMLRAEYMARSSVQLAQLLIVVQGSIQRALMSNAATQPLADAIVITDYASFLTQAIGGDAEARGGLGGLIGLDLGSVKGLGTPAGTSMDLNISSEEGRYFLNCGGGGQGQTQKTNLYLLLSAMVQPPRYDRLFNVPDADGVILTREDLARNLIDYTDVDMQRYEAQGGGSGGEERYDRGRDRYEGHNYFLDTMEESHLVRGFSEDVWGAFGGLFTVYGRSDCKILATAITADAWPLVAAMIAASSSDRTAVLDPNTALVAQQVSGMLKSGLPMLKQLAKSGDLKIKCEADQSKCQKLGVAPPPPPKVPPPGAPPLQGAPQGQANNASDSVSLLSDVICSQYVGQLATLGATLAPLSGTAPPQLTTALRPIPMCKGQLAQYLSDQPLGSGAAQTGTRRFFRVEASGAVQRGKTRETKVHIRAVWDAQGFNQNPLCQNHARCNTGTWVYWRID